MGNKKKPQLTVLAVALTITIVLVYHSTDSVVATKPYDLKTALGPVSGYTLLQSIPLDQGISTFLDLDDYTQTVYKKGGELLNLYIGYYNSLDKVSAAHSPTVCFPGQGWEIDQPVEHQISVKSNTINHAEIIASLEDNQHLVLYWYQAGNKTSPQVYRNKINAMLNNVLRNKQEHAFVRISIPFEGQSRDTARETIVDFIESFYPIFLEYINSTQ